MLSNTKRKKETCVAKKAVVHRHERCILYVRARKKEEKGKRTQKKKKKNHVYNVKSKAQKKGYLQSSQSAAETTRNKIVKDLKTIKTVFW